ncbi:DUF2301 domain-containing membrane protein [Leptolyngbya sp. PCC 6406]|uniref:DUF2301 domain-containing membrane protein n=1 Tax=Leptolyngbya sp. PCC 6406 TaxID=1173264 RepID=UPI0002ACDFAE|nr:DUF2301 domain-containing membrane protein [Leptolyngbya sp. PCC 6406]
MVFPSPSTSPPTSEVYQGQFGEFTITEDDRWGVRVYRGGLAIAALSLVLSTMVVLWPQRPDWALAVVSGLYGLFWLALGVSLWTIHIYLKPLHRLLQVFWLVGGVASLVVAHGDAAPFVQTVYQHPVTLWGVGFTFVALTGIYFKEAFCFNRLEAKVLTPLVPLLLLGHLAGVWSVPWATGMLIIWAVGFTVFALRKLVQAIPDDVGDKSVFVYLAQQRQAPSEGVG